MITFTPLPVPIGQYGAGPRYCALVTHCHLSVAVIVSRRARINPLGSGWIWAWHVAGDAQGASDEEYERLDDTLAAATQFVVDQLGMSEAVATWTIEGAGSKPGGPPEAMEVAVSAHGRIDGVIGRIDDLELHLRSWHPEPFPGLPPRPSDPGRRAPFRKGPRR